MIRNLVTFVLGLGALLGIGVMFHVLLVLTDPAAPLSRFTTPPAADTRWHTPDPPADPDRGTRKEPT